MNYILYASIAIILLIIINYIILNFKKNKEITKLDIYFKDRWELSQQLAQIVKPHASHQPDLQKEIDAMLKKTYSKIKKSELILENIKLEKLLQKMVSISTFYPDLKFDSDFNNLNNNIININKNIELIRPEYNKYVVKYNKTIKNFPYNIIVKLFNIKQLDEFSSTK